MKNNNEILSVKDIFASYYKKEVLKGVSLFVKYSEIVALIGPNGSGKSTLLKVIIGILQPTSGEILFNYENITHTSPKERTTKGIGYFVQGGKVFPSMTIYENLLLGGINLKKSELQQRIEEIFELFPHLKEKKSVKAGLLSGGEKQALALSMVLLRKPKLLLLDEPSAGLSPLLVKQMINTIKEINIKYKTTIVLVEQNIKEALDISHRVYLLKNGQIIGEEKPENLLDREKIHNLFFT
jgi:branched-chain amino acid transport system ATP-binding protein